MTLAKKKKKPLKTKKAEIKRVIFHNEMTRKLAKIFIGCRCKGMRRKDILKVIH